MKKNLLLAVILSLQLMAQSEKGLIELEKTIVTAERFEVSERKIAKNAYVLTKEDIKSSKAVNVVELLKSVPSIVTSNGYTNEGVIDLRGQGEAAKSNVLILVDGVSLNSIDMSGPDLSSINVGSIERIEVVPSGGVVYGDKAVGGVVNIITDKSSNKLKIESGSYGLLNYGLNLNQTLGSTLISANISKQTIDGYRKNSNSDKSSVGLGLTYPINDNNKLSVSYAFNESQINFPGSLTKTQLENDRTDSIKGSGDSNIQKNNYGFIYNFSKNNFELENKLNYFDKINKYNYDGWGSNEITSKTLINNTKLKYTSGNNSIITGLDYNKGNSTTDTSNIYKTQIGLYALDSLNLTENLNMSGGIRKENVTLDYTTGKEKVYNKSLYSLGLNYLYSDTGSIYISKELNYRTPVIDEYYNSYTDYYSESLEPQVSDVVEFGIKEYLGNSYVKASYYVSNTDNEIFYNPSTYANENIDGKTERKGFELSTKTFIGNLTLSQALSLIDAKVTEGVYKDKLIPWVPQNRYVLNTSYTLNHITLSAEFIHTGETVAISDWSNSKGKVESYNTINFSTSYEIGGINIYGGIKNLTNKKYNEYVTYGTKFYPAPERNYFLGITYEF